MLEGVMMRSEKYTAIAVRQDPGNIVTQRKNTKMLREKYKILGVPIIRGVVNFVEMLVSGVKTITDAAKMYDPEMAEEEKPSKMEEFIAKKTGKDSMDVAIFFAVIIAVLLAVGLFFILPNLITGWITPYIEVSFWKNLVDGVVRIAIFLLYLGIVTSLKDIKRLFGYHGAEHKVINCYEHEQPLTVESARKCSRFHPRCGTSFLLIVMVISILLFTMLGWSDNLFLRLLQRLAMLPIVAGVSYEVLKLLGKYDNKFVDVLRAPGMALQRITTREPDDGMLEVALVSFQLAEGVKTQAQIKRLIRQYDRTEKPADEEKGQPEEAEATEAVTSDATAEAEVQEATEN